jgi:NAD(P)-dependent dehydrogenase (short-subunit alcohol dehydrogenase family)
MDVNVDSVLFIAQPGGRQMEKFGTPESIILTVSMIGSITDYDQHWVAYNTSRSTVKQMARSITCEFGPRRIRVNTVGQGIFTSNACFLG